MFKFLRAAFEGDINIGLYGFATDDYCLLGLEPKQKEQIKDILGVSIHNIKLAQTQLIGLFASGNRNGVIITKLLERDELKAIKKALPDLNILVLKSAFTATGNLVLCNDKGCIISKEISKQRKKIEDVLGCETLVGTVAGLDIVGSAATASNIGCLCHSDTNETEAKVIEELLKVKVDVGTVSAGSQYIKSGIIVNSNGVIVSQTSTGPELGRIAEVFGD